MPPSQQVIGPTNTVRLCTVKDARASTDPWLEDDPWKHALAHTKIPEAPATGSNALQALEDRLEKSILAKIPAPVEHMEVDDQESRLSHLENQLQALNQRQTKLETVVADNHAQSTAQAHSLQQQMAGQFEVQSQQLQSLLTDQMAKIETLLSKKARTERCARCPKAEPEPGANRWSFRPLRAFLTAVLFMMSCRIGEAKVPGPSFDDGKSWSLGVCNPSGLQGKFHILSSVKADVLCLSETHLTKGSTCALKGSLRSMRSPFKNVITGAPLAPRTTASEAGTWAGVGFVTTCPSRTVAVPWPLDLYESGRIQFVGAFLEPAWVTGAVVYGYPAGKNHVDAQQRTVRMLDFACDHLLSLHGPRFVGGDWNYEPHELAITDRLKAAGWTEIQDLEFQRTGAIPVATCKAKTRKDVLWISPELALSFQGLTICATTFADHAILTGHFGRDPSANVRYVWPCPRQVQWTSTPDIQQPVQFGLPHDPTVQYASLWQQCEQQAQRTMGKDWMPSMAGRAQQLRPVKKKGWPAPPKPSRSHEIQPLFFGFSMVHARWFKQLRRLQNYCRWIDNVFASGLVSDGLHGLALWKSILDAPGFSPSFAQWWPSREVCRPQDPLHIPLHKPRPEVARQIFDTMVAETRLLEQRLLSAKRAHRRHQHATDRNLIYKEVAKDRPEPVETLLHKVEATVQCLDEGDCAVELDRPVDLLAAEQVWIGGVPVEVIHAEHDKLWLTDTAGIQPKDRVIQTKPVGDLDTIFQAFHDQWRLRWCKHDAIPNSQWQDIVDFAAKTMRPRLVQPLRLDEALIRAEIKRKKKTAATGLDGISKLDLQQAGNHVIHSILNMYARAHLDGSWPKQILAGKVHSLAKEPGASLPNQFRPITVFGLPYRIWSSLQSRYLLNQADEWLHEGVHGNRRHLQAAHVWTAVADEIQSAYASGVPLAGIAADIEKCFNTIPRWPTLIASILAGTPEGVNLAWAGALSSMIRHFKVRDSYSCGFETSTGLAEGCGMSVFGMCLLDHLFHTWLQCQVPSIRSLSYVDDWQTLTRDPAWACRQLDLVMSFATMLDFTIDQRKTVAWATAPELRASLRAAGLQVVHHAKELGSHMAISRQYTNRTIQDRIAALEPFWEKLRISQCGHATKIRVLNTVAWPRGLHAVSAVPVGHSVWMALRRKAKGALNYHKAGVNGFVLLLIDRPVDPELVAVIQTFKDIRTFQRVDFWTSTVYPCACGLLDLPPNSPAQVVLSRIQPLGFLVEPDGRLRDVYGSFCPHSVHFAELLLRVNLAWVHFVAAQVAHRTEFDGLAHADVAATQQALRKLSLSDRALLRLVLAGGFVTEDTKAKWSEQTDQCKHCGARDSLRHRYWECPAYEVARNELAPDVLPVLDSLPSALALRGWSIHPSTMTRWLGYLGNIPVHVPSLAMPLSTTAWNHVFTDGSCLSPEIPSARLAAWSAVLASPDLSCECPVGVLGASVLPGLCQTAFRAELYALAVVVHWCALSGASVCLWLDCLGVVNKFVLVIRGGWLIPCNHPHADLWKWIQCSVAHLGADRVRVHKVDAHKQLVTAKSQLDRWKIAHNDAADRTAKLANQARSHSVWQLWQQHVRELFAAEALATQVRALQLAVARAQVRQQAPEVAVSVEAPAHVRPTRQFALTYDNSGWTGTPLPLLAHKYGAGHATRAIAWWTARTMDRNQGDVKWVSFVQLYVDYNLTFGQPGPLKVGKIWVDVASRPYLDPMTFAFRTRVRWFRRFLQNLLTEGKVITTYQQCLPSSNAILAHVPCLAVKWSEWHLDRIDTWLQAHLQEKCTRNASALIKLPPIQRDAAMAVELRP
eukprot:s1324_g20.t1